MCVLATNATERDFMRTNPSTVKVVKVLATMPLTADIK